jgi:RNA polymerase sigma-70 factor (sigma-E family)
MSLEQTLNTGDVGRPKDLRALYELHAAEAGRLAYMLTGDRHLAEDVVHEAFIRAGVRLAHLRKADSFPAYLRRAIVNLCRSHWRRESVRRAFLQRAEPPVPVHQPDLAQRSEVTAALQRLSSRQRTAVVLRYYEDLTEEQTADMLGCSTAAVKSLLHRAKSALREELGGADD